MRIVDLLPDDQAAIHQAASLLSRVIREHSADGWPDMAEALEEVCEFSGPDRISRVAVDGAGSVLGWIGGTPHYNGHVWELHPLVVQPDHQRKGIGRALVADLEALVRARGGLTLWVGTDDEDDRTTLSGTDLYPNPLEHLGQFQNLRGHPYEFYQKVGFVIVGVMPDANGWGKPDIYMAKRISR